MAERRHYGARGAPDLVTHGGIEITSDPVSRGDFGGTIGLAELDQRSKTWDGCNQLDGRRVDHDAANGPHDRHTARRPPRTAGACNRRRATILKPTRVIDGTDVRVAGADGRALARLSRGTTSASAARRATMDGRRGRPINS